MLTGVEKMEEIGGGCAGVEGVILHEICAAESVEVA
jgi:hypothetical protein